MQMQMQDRTIFVTGGTRGIGRALVQNFVWAGARVAFSYRQDKEAAESVAKELAGAPGSVLAIQCDSRDLEAARAAVRLTEQEMGPLYGLVNNAGISRDRLLHLMKSKDWQDVIDTNLTGTYNFCRAVIYGMLKRKSGRIVNVGSISGVLGNPGQVNYSAAKAGAIGLTKALARETARAGITVNLIAPGFIDTDMIESLPERMRSQINHTVPMGRLGRPEEVAHLARYLLSDESAYMTGQVLVLDGGIAI